ncbi:DUF998 domain-containing protein [Streptomyces sp. BPTC-684]|uniref:DUF998 domain-containing protein n=1 Tax=Streptomyces sp. BPTC-684 TaxID=3043734 RepID=UPI0024B117BD|nr:DUF998 domain-containing protein [Streptomyces sp. BPTC-684]WHM40923.1 DUF998 domain-containing protein [Streptomyces sp. BPTC-684]
MPAAPLSSGAARAVATGYGHTPSARRRRTVAVSLLAVTAVAYNDWLLQFVLLTGLSQRDSYVSELFAADQPHRVLFSAIELTCALLVLTAAMLARSLYGQPLARAGWAALAGVGVFSVADVLLPMRCAPSIEPGCEVASLRHTLTSGLVHFALFASMALVTAAARREALSLTLVRRWGPWLLPVSMAAAIATVGPFFGHPGGQGLAQRAHLATAGFWFVLLAAELRRRGARPGRGGAPSP